MDDKKQGAAVWILVGCLGLFFLVVCGGAGAWVLFAGNPMGGPEPHPGPVPGLPPSPTGPAVADGPRHVVASVTSSTGAAPISTGAICEFDVTREPRPDGTFWCRAQVLCGGQLLYGGEQAGFFNCTLYDQPVRHVVGGEQDTTSADGDAAMFLDTLQGTLTIRDDAGGRFGAYSVTASVQSVR